MDLALRIAEWDGFEARRAEREARGKLLGLGLANYVESSIGSPRERAEITVAAGGHASKWSSARSRAARATRRASRRSSPICSSVPVEQVEIVIGDTDIVSVGGGSHSGRSMRHAATVIAMAAEELIEQGQGASRRSCSTRRWSEIVFADGRFAAPASNRSFDFLELAREAARLTLPEDLAGGLAVAADNEMHDPVFPNGCRGVRGRDRSRDRRARRSPATPRSTMSGAASIR